MESLDGLFGAMFDKKQPEVQVPLAAKAEAPKADIGWMDELIPKRQKMPQPTVMDLNRNRLYGAVEWVESRGKVNAVSPKGAIGPMQTMPKTLLDPGYGVTPAKDRSVGELRRVGQEYVDAMIREYGLEGGLAAYNWGPGNWQKALKRANGDVRKALASAPEETRNYVPKVLARLNSR